MRDKTKNANGTKNALIILGIVVLGIVFIVGLILLFASNNQILQYIGSITSTISCSLEVAFTLNFNFDIKINNTVNSTVNQVKNDFDMEIKTYRQEIKVLRQSIINNTNNINVNYVDSKNKDEEAIKKISDIYQPIESFVSGGSTFDGAVNPTPFENLCDFSKNQFNTPYMLSDQKLYDIYLELCILNNKFNLLYENAVILTSNPPYVTSKYIKMDKDSRHKIQIYTSQELEDAQRTYYEFWETTVKIVNKFQELIREYKK